MSNLPVQKLKIRTVFRAPVTAAKVIDIEANGVALRNGGLATVRLNSGAWTLLPGESLHLGSQTDLNLMVISALQVSFDTTLGSTTKLEIIELHVSPC